jgi:hypothetical protein
MNVIHIGNFKAPQERIPIKILLGNSKSSARPIHDTILKKIIDSKKGKYIHLTEPSDIKINKTDQTEIVILQKFPSKSKITIQSPNPLTIISIDSQVEINYEVNNLNYILNQGKCGKRIISETPKSQTESPKSQTESPKSQTESPKSQTESPKSQTESPKSQTESPKSNKGFTISGISQEQKAKVKSIVESKQENVNKVNSGIKVTDETSKSSCPVCPTLVCPQKEKCPGCPACPACPVCEKCKYKDTIKSIKPNIKAKIKSVKKDFEDSKTPAENAISTTKTKNTWIIALLVLFIVAGTFGYIYWSHNNKETKSKSNWTMI